jgi:hypothetical protein
MASHTGLKQCGSVAGTCLREESDDVPRVSCGLGTMLPIDPPEAFHAHFSSGGFTMLMPVRSLSFLSILVL